LQVIKFARDESENCKKRKIQRKALQFAFLRIRKEWNLQENQKLEFTRNRICKEKNLQGTELEIKRGRICKE